MRGALGLSVQTTDGPALPRIGEHSVPGAFSREAAFRARKVCLYYMHLDGVLGGLVVSLENWQRLAGFIKPPVTPTRG